MVSLPLSCFVREIRGVRRLHHHSTYSGNLLSEVSVNLPSQFKEHKNGMLYHPLSYKKKVLSHITEPSHITELTT